MALEAGTRLGDYEVVSSLGAGGMGEVYRAKDTKLGREVAIKVLPEGFSDEPERMARFEREAKVLASLNHNNIATLYSFEADGSTRFLVMEVVEGETLAERIKRGAIPVNEALQLFLQIAEGLEAAHEKGVLHRDLKPANIKVTDDGNVKILDFGLAKAMAPEEPVSDEAALSESPTLTLAATQRGEILGTAAYMSPEQARGRSIDKRTDIWAFGVCLFEALSGSSPFPGDTSIDVLGGIVGHDPEWSTLPLEVPPGLQLLIRRCLTKEIRDRVHDIADARIEMQEAIDASDFGTPASTLGVPSRGRRTYAIVGLAVGVVLGALGSIWSTSWQEERKSIPASGRPTVHSAIDLPDEASLAFGSATRGYDSPLIALSPDGSRLVYVGQSSEGPLLYRREMATFGDPEPIRGTEGAIYAFFSPDGQSVGFLTHDKLKRVSIRGDNLQTVCDVRTPVRASWTRDGFIYFTEDETTTLSRVRASGGEPEEVVTRLAQGRTGQVLPDGKTVLLTESYQQLSEDYADIVLLDLDTLESRLLVKSGYDARYIPTGHLLFARGGSLLAVAFDLERSMVTSEPVTVVRGVHMDSFFGQVQIAISASGTLAYVPGGDRAKGKIASIDRQGNEAILPIEARLYGALDLAPDDQRLAVHVADVKDYIWIYDIQRSEGRKLAGSDDGGWPKWSGKGDEIAYSKRTREGSALMRQAIDSGRIQRRISFFDFVVTPTSWSPDDRVLAIHSFKQGRFGFVATDDDSEPDWVDAQGAKMVHPRFSPDGRWVAYLSNVTGAIEVWVRSYPDGSGARQVSVGGGVESLWCTKCNELFFRNGNRWLASHVSLEPELSLEPARLLFETEFIDTPGVSYDVSSDGQRLFVVKTAEPDSRTEVRVITAFFDQLTRLVPTD